MKEIPKAKEVVVSIDNKKVGITSIHALRYVLENKIVKSGDTIPQFIEGLGERIYFKLNIVKTIPQGLVRINKNTKISYVKT